MERIKLDYERLRAGIARGDSAHIEVEARKLRDQEMAKLVYRAAAGAWSVIIAIGHGALAWRTHLYQVAPKANRLSGDRAVIAREACVRNNEVDAAVAGAAPLKSPAPG